MPVIRPYLALAHAACSRVQRLYSFEPVGGGSCAGLSSVGYLRPANAGPLWGWPVSGGPLPLNCQ